MRATDTEFLIPGATVKEGNVYRSTSLFMKAPDSARDASENFFASVTDEGFKLQIMMYPVEKIRSLSKGRKEISILDVGASYGRTLSCLQRSFVFPKYVACDIRFDAMRRFADDFKDALCVNLDITKLSSHIRPQSFDFVIFTEVLEHFVQKEGIEVLVEITKMLKPDGHLVMTTPNGAFGPDMAKELKTFGHLYLWKKEELKGQLNRLGLRVSEALDGKYMSSGLDFRGVEKVMRERWGTAGEEMALYFRQHYGTGLSTYILGGLCGERAGEMKILAQKTFAPHFRLKSHANG